MINPRFEANGWQAVVADGFTFERLRLVTQAICNYARRQQSYIDNFPPRLVVGYDSRFMARHFAHVAAEVVTINGLDVFLSDRPAPTPVVSWLIAEQKASAAIMITGSNESEEFNGVKFITSHMATASEDATEAIEQEMEFLMQKTNVLTYAMNPGEKTEFNPKAGYFYQIQQLVNIPLICQAHMDIYVDYLYGIAAGYFRELFLLEGGAVHESRHEPRSDFGNLVPTLNQENLHDLQQSVAHSPESIALGILIDGDGSHMQAVDEKGKGLDHEVLFALLIAHLVQNRQWEGGIVKTAETGGLDEQVARYYGRPIYFTGTSDFRHITHEMVKNDALLASDGLGGYAFKGHIMERDGILAGLLTMEMCAMQQKGLGALTQDLMALLATQKTQ